MRVIIAGSRDITDYRIIKEAIEDSQFSITTVVSGRAKGVDSLGEQWAMENYIPIDFHPADWNKFGKRAGYLRNVQMAENADALIAIWDGVSKGTGHMINIAKEKGLKVYIHYVNK